ncbi:hypothetical protein KU616_23960, partial [Salmonella enterica subsp. enterica serovar Mbandaka]|nr:hypothetical protein [Salmonella enterica subsp. enterica serovar Mbandaka]
LDFMYSLKKRTGVVSISGTYYVDNKMSGVIRRDVSYVWSENKATMALSQDGVTDTFPWIDIKIG